MKVKGLQTMQRLYTFVTRRSLLAIAFALAFWAGAGNAAAQSSVFADLPRANATVAPDFHIGGWAIDWAARQSTGVMTIHVWAYPSTGEPPIFLGVPSRGARSDIARVYGQNFLNCGYGLNVRGLAPGDYLIAVFPFSDIRGAFDYDSALAIPVSVRRPAQSSPRPAPRPSPAPAPSPEPEPTPDPSSGSTLRVLMWNLHHGVGTDGDYDIERIADWMAEMDPDVILLNEVEKFTSWGHEDQPARYRAMLEARTGRTWYSHFTQEYGSGSANGKGHQMLSVFPFNATGHGPITPSDGLRGAGAISQAAITVNGRTINLLLTHLDPYDRSMRLRQARDAISFAQGFVENRILAGDMNAWPDQSSIAEYNRTYHDSWTLADRQGRATGVRGITPFGATKRGRIDYIFLSRSAADLEVVDSKVWDTRDARGDMPSDHRPVVTTFRVR